MRIGFLFLLNQCKKLTTDLHAPIGLYAIELRLKYILPKITYFYALTLFLLHFITHKMLNLKLIKTTIYHPSIPPTINLGVLL